LALEHVVTVMVLLGLLVLSGVVARFLKVAPLLVQIGLGALAGGVSSGIHVVFDPEVFMVLFVPPLLFADGWGMPKREFARYIRPIFFMAFGLVFFTVWALGYLIHWLVPSLPLAAAFALAAVLSPTDAVALGSITGGRRMQERAAHILRGEALLNDASGLVSFKFAMAALLTGAFSLSEAAWGFVLIGAGGAGVGVALAWCCARVMGIISLRREGETTTESLLMLLLPFASYVLAEHLKVSGIMAVVAAGMFMSQSSYFRSTQASMRIEARFTWGVLSFVFNGVIFLLLGFYLPVAVRHASAAGHGSDASLWYVLFLALLIALAMTLLRGLWLGMAIGVWGIYDWIRGNPSYRPTLIGSVLVSVAGVRGAITLAAVLSVPLTLANGTVFEGRELMIALAVGVILWSLAIAQIGVPLALRLARPDEQDPAQEELRMARASAGKAAIIAVEKRYSELSATLDDESQRMHERLVESLRTHFGGLTQMARQTPEERNRSRMALALSLDLQLMALTGARQEIFKMRDEGTINDETFDQVMSDLDLREAYLRETLGEGAEV
jgi:monovalent cation/hydrogen antiporter